MQNHMKQADENPLISISNLCHRFPDGTTALNGINLEIEKESFTVIAGKNGSGKTVLMKHLNGILAPTSGTVSVCGIDVKKDPWNARRRIGFVFQNPDTQIVAQTVRDDIAFGPENLGYGRTETAETVNAAATAMDISHILEHSPHRLSGGEKKRVSIAGIIAMDPELIVFDEPFTGLDYSGVKILLKKMLEVHKNGTSVIVITHDLEKVLAHADRLIILSGGNIVADGDPGKLLDTAKEHELRIPSGCEINRMSWLR